MIPAHMAAEVAAEACEMKDREKFLLKEIEAGKSIVGVYRPGDETMTRYRAWRLQQNRS